MTGSFTSKAWVKWLLAFTAGLLSGLALIPPGILPPPFHLLEPYAPLLILDLAVALGYAVLAWYPREAFFYAHATGFGWFLVSLFWMAASFTAAEGAHTPFNAVLVPLTIIGMPFFLAMFWGAAAALAVALVQPLKLRLIPSIQARLVLLVALLALAEFARGNLLSGLPWASPGMVFANIPGGMAAASVFGLWGLTFIALGVAVIPMLLILGSEQDRKIAEAGGRSRIRNRYGLAIAAAALFVCALAAGQIFAPRASTPPEAGLPESTPPLLNARLVQPAIPQHEKWQGAEQRRANILSLIALSQGEGEGEKGADPDLIIWPETAFEGVLERDGDTLIPIMQSAAGDSGGAPIPHVLTGLLREDAQSRVYNSAALFTATGDIAGLYDKTHLVPFGEYIPLQRFIPFTEIVAGPGGFSPGQGRVAMTLPTAAGREIRILPLICYEVIFPGAVRAARLRHNPDLLVVITNDAWFGKTIGPHQHLAMARMRSAELGIPQLRVANTGISAVIDHRGKITHRLGLGRTGFIDAAIPAIRGNTLYTRMGNTLFWMMILAAMILAFVVHRGVARFRA